LLLLCTSLADFISSAERRRQSKSMRRQR
jgi:hypothetical protein